MLTKMWRCAIVRQENGIVPFFFISGAHARADWLPKQPNNKL